MLSVLWSCCSIALACCLGAEDGVGRSGKLALVTITSRGSSTVTSGADCSIISLASC